MKGLDCSVWRLLTADPYGAEGGRVEAGVEVPGNPVGGLRRWRSAPLPLS